MNVENPHTREQILEAIVEAEAAVASFFGSLTTEELVLRESDRWTAAEHLVHLNTSVSAVARGLAAPRLLLRLCYGRGAGASRSYSEIRDMYRGRLAEGEGASGAFVPPREEAASPELVEQRRAALLARWQRVNARLRAALEPWEERQLDRIRMPHPILGLLTTREMLLFTLYHDGHHIEAAKRRLPARG